MTTGGFFFLLGIIVILILEFYSGLSGRVRTVYLFSLCVVTLLSSRFATNALVWYFNCLKTLVFHTSLKERGTRRRGRRRKQLLDDLKEARRYWKVKEEAQNRTL
jgi:hypothetical protein